MENENSKTEEHFNNEVAHLSSLVKDKKAKEVMIKYGIGHLYSLDGESRIILENILGVEQKSAVDLFNLGVLALEKEDLKKAEENFKNAIKLDATYSSPHFNLALIHEVHDEAAKAKKEWQKYVEKEEAFQEAKGIRISNESEEFDYLAEAKDRLESKGN